MNQNFFQEQREQSLIKTRIVSKYFSAWANVILNAKKRWPGKDQHMAYVDLFAGPGRYGDQNQSTPLLVLEIILSNPDLRERMRTYFNDKDSKNIKELKTIIENLPEIHQLKYPPEFVNMEVGDEIAKRFGEMNIVPTFFFVDPWGYKGLSLDLISSIIKDWGCDCVFFFNYNRINMGINNDVIKSHMASIFGEERLEALREEIKNPSSPAEREMIVVQALCEVLKNNGSRFVLPFRFKNDDGSRTSHHLIFMSKHFLGYDIMKKIMANESSDSAGGVANFEYNPRDKHYRQGSLFDMLSRPLNDLRDMLLTDYAGKTLDFTELYENHSVDKPYVKKNYKDVLRELLDEGLISAENPKTHKPPRKDTFSDKMRITFRGET